MGSLKTITWRFALFGADDSQRVTGRETVYRWRMLICRTLYQMRNAKFWSMGMRRMRATVKDREGE